MSHQVLGNIIVAVVWVFLQNEFTGQNFAVGYLVGAAFSFFLSRNTGEKFYLRRVVAALELLVVFLYELVVANVKVAYLVLHPKLPVRPGLIKVPLAVTSDSQITMFARMVTMTPGTIFVDVSPDQKYAYVHVLDLDDPGRLRDSLKSGFERRILEVMS